MSLSVKRRSHAPNHEKGFLGFTHLQWVLLTCAAILIAGVLVTQGSGIGALYQAGLNSDQAAAVCNAKGGKCAWQLGITTCSQKSLSSINAGCTKCCISPGVVVNRETFSSPISVTSQCSAGNPPVTISWPVDGIQGTADFWVDIAADPQFKQYWHKNVSQGSTRTAAPNGFTTSDDTELLTFIPGKTYYARLYYSATKERIGPKDFVAPPCSGNNEGDEANRGPAVTVSCSGSSPAATISWIPTSIQSLGNFYVDVGTNPTFVAGSYSHKRVETGLTTTSAPEGFINPPLTLTHGRTYYARIYYEYTDERTSASPIAIPKNCGGGSTSVCKNGTCESGESAATCPEDCGVNPPPVCNNNSTCEPGETVENCAQDCSVAPPVCNINGTCEPPGETISTCPQDCSAAPPPPPSGSATVDSIVTESGMETSQQAPLGSRVLGDNWGAYLASSQSIRGMARSYNITEIGIETKDFNDYLNGTKSIEASLKDAPGAFGVLGLTKWEQLKIADRIGMNVEVNIDSSCNSGSSYHSCNSGATLQGPFTSQAQLDRVQNLYSDLIAYLRDSFPNVTHVQIENEPCYKTFTPAQYVSLVRTVVPAIRSANPTMRILVGDSEGSQTAACGNAVADAGLDVDILGLHFATPSPSTSTDSLVANIKNAVKYLKKTYPRYQVWVDETGIGRLPWSTYEDSGAERAYRMLKAAFDNGATGAFYVWTGGLDNAPTTFMGKKFEMILYSVNRGESKAAGRIRDLARQIGTAW